MKSELISKSLRVSIIIAFSMNLAALGVSTLQNGDFSAGLNNWYVEYGNVSDGGGFAFFQEPPDILSSTISQVFTIPALADELSFDVVMTSVPGGDYDLFSWPDAFTACLLDPVTLAPLLSNPEHTDFYYWDYTGHYETIAIISGNKVSLDISGLAGMDAYLAFDLWSGYDGMITTINLDNVEISIIPAPGALILALFGTGTIIFWKRFNNRTFIQNKESRF